MLKNSSRLSTVGAIVVGPVLGLLYMCFIPLLSLFFVLSLLPRIVAAEAVVLSDEAMMCLGCHSDKALTKTFQNKEKLSLFVDENQFKGTVHSFATCTNCHMNISMDNHPGMTVFKSKRDFLVEASSACRRCHADETIMMKPTHRYIVSQPNAPPCADCHSAHSVKRMADWKPRVQLNQYCLTCHKQQLSISIKGEVMSLSIDESLLKGSVHNRHACSDCHSEFSKEQHPVRTFENKREHSIAVSGVCRKCHIDKYTQVEGSIHYTMLKEGDLKAPVCTDCHGFHSVGSKAIYETLIGVPCKKCHEDIFKAYTGSVHGSAKAKGHHKAPICSNCHRAHDVKVTSLTDIMKKACLECHKDVENDHKKWLWSAPVATPSLVRLHLDNIACAVCHSPDAGRGIYLQLYDSNTGKPFSEEEVQRLLGPEYPGLMDPHGDGIDPSELWSIVRQLNAKGAKAKVTFLGRMDVSKGIEAHQLAIKKEAVRECERCHSATSDFFNNVTVAIIKADGRPVLYNAKREVLGSIFSVLPVSQFYALGSTRVKLLDILFILAVLGGLSFPLAHITVRILTAPIRSMKRMGKGGKK